MDVVALANRRAGKHSGSADLFIERALNKIDLLVCGDTEEKPIEGVLVHRERDGADDGILYTYVKDGLRVGDCVIAPQFNGGLNVVHLLIEPERRVDGSKVINVFKTREVNVTFRNGLLGYLRSNLSSSIRDSGKEEMSVEAKEAVLVTTAALVQGEVVKLDSTKSSTVSQNWVVVGSDNISSPPIRYVHLRQVETPETESTTPAANELKAGTYFRVETANFEFASTPSVTVRERKENYVIFLVPKSGSLSVTTALGTTEYTIGE